MAIDMAGDETFLSLMAEEIENLNQQPLLQFWQAITRVDASARSFDEQMGHMKRQFASRGKAIEVTASPTPMLIGAEPDAASRGKAIEVTASPTPMLIGAEPD